MFVVLKKIEGEGLVEVVRFCGVLCVLLVNCCFCLFVAVIYLYYYYYYYYYYTGVGSGGGARGGHF